MALTLEWSEEALEDIESIATYIEKDSPTYAKSVVSKFFEKAEILQEFSELGRKVPEFNDTTISEIFVYSDINFMLNNDITLRIIDMDERISREKERIREHIWRLLLEEKVASFPLPVRGRIPNFAGSIRAAIRLAQHEIFSKAKVVFVSPDSPQRPVRELVLRSGKIHFIGVVKEVRYKEVNNGYR